VENPPATVTTENSRPDQHSSETSPETEKTEGRDGNSTSENDEVDSVLANEEPSLFSGTAETLQQHEVESGSVNSYDVSVSEGDGLISVSSTEEPVTTSSGSAESMTSG
jgi:hypothetical protein